MWWGRFFRRRPEDAEFNEELESHLRMAIEDRVARGESPEEARRAARLELGNAGLVKEDTRAVWTWVWLERLGQDVRYALRQMHQGPGFTAAAVLTLAFGLSVNITIFSMISSIFLRPLPVKDAERLVVVLRKHAGSGFAGGLSWRDYQDYRAGIAEFSDMLALAFRPAHVKVAERVPDRTWIEAVSPNYFSMLGVAPLHGRFFLPGEGEKAGADPLAVLGFDYWSTRLGADPGLVGRSVAINGRAFTVIGIAPRSFASAQWAMNPSLFIPATMMPEIFPGNEAVLEKRDSGAFKVMAHLSPGVSEAQATGAVALVSQRLDREYRPDAAEAPAFVRPERLTRPEPSVSSFAPFAAVAFLVMAGLVLFIACANVANLMFSRAMTRSRELGIRAAIGAGRRRLVRQMLTESIVLAVLAGVVGMLLTEATAPLLTQLAAVQSGDIPIRQDEGWKWLPVVFTMLASVIVGVVTGLIPALRATRVDPYAVLKGGGSGTGPERHVFRSGLVLSQVAVSVVVLVSGGLFVHSLLELTVHDLGFRAERLLMASVDVGLQGYDEERSRRFMEQLTDQVDAVPGVESAAIAASVPFDMYFTMRRVVSVDDPAAHDGAEGEDGPQAGVNRVDPDYFGTMGVALLKGRTFTDHDSESSPPVAVVNERFAKRLWPGENPLGKRFRWQAGTNPIEVVGVVRNGKYVFLGETPRPYAYVPIAQDHSTLVTLHARTAMDDALVLEPVVRGIVGDLDPDLPVFNVRTMEEHVRGSAYAFMPLRMGATLAGAQGIVALLLAVMGVYGVVAYAVSRQRREIGIRVALGARRIDVFRLVSRSGLGPALIGLALGLLASVGLARLLTALLYGLDPMNPAVFAAVTAIVLSIAFLACWLPARRAARVDPIEVLRHE